MKTDTPTTTPRPTHELIRSLAGDHSEPCITIVIQREFAGNDSDSTRLKRAISLIKDALREHGLGQRDIAILTDQLQTVMGRNHLWQPGEGGVAIYLNSQRLELVELPAWQGDHLHIGPTFDILPLVQVSEHNEPFYLLELSINRVRLLACDRFGHEGVHVPDMPTSIEQGPKRFKEYEEAHQHHIADRPAGDLAANLHGHNVGDDDEEIDRKEFFVAVAKALRDGGFTDRPTVIACDRPHRPMFREHAHMDTILESGPDGSPDYADDNELRKEAWSYVEPRTHEHFDRDLDLVREAQGHDRCATKLEECDEAARNGRVDLLLVERNGHSIQPDPQNHPSALTRTAAAHAVSTGARVRLVDDFDKSGITSASRAAAVLRW
jgi:hypothetical protein